MVRAPRRSDRELPSGRLKRRRLEELDARDAGPSGARDMVVDPTRAGTRGRALSPDVALCAACRAELDDPDDRRARYAFKSCSDCGPRFTVVRELPYDRDHTSMACFPLCARCLAEYEDVDDRRFLAEPVCCPDCGPRLWVTDARGRQLGIGQHALALARSALAAGGIVALKGLGGFQLASRADSEAAVERLRVRRSRPAKPLAVMARDLEVARRIVRLRPEDDALLTSPIGPILLASRVDADAVAPNVAPGLDDLGVMLPTTPLHVELFRDAPYDTLVVTSGKRGDARTCIGNRDALEHLGEIADRFVLHDRDVVRRVDDSIVRTAPEGHVVLRRSRGYVPRALPIGSAASEPILALGGQMQNTCCVAFGGAAYPSQHVGDLRTDDAREVLLQVARDLEDLLEIESRVVVTDLHPDYPSTLLGTELARARGARIVRVQHHVAHAAAVLAEHDALPAPGEDAFALVLDGTGFGPDGTAWGTEWLRLGGDLAWSRLAAGTALPLPGGRVAVDSPWRIAVATLAEAGFARVNDLPVSACIDRDRIQAVACIDGGSGSRARGAGLLFDAAGALLGLCPVHGYDGEGALRLEQAAASEGLVPPWPEVVLAPGAHELPSAAMLTAVAWRALSGEPIARIAAGLHATFCALAAELTHRVVPKATRAIAVGGDCLVSRVLRRGLEHEFARRGRTALFAREAPPGDGGLAYGQAALAGLARARDREVSTEPRDDRCAARSR